MAETAVDLGWCIVELLGHVRLAGRVREQQLFSTNVCRLDIPGEGDTWIATQYIGGSALYRVTPCAEEIARAVAARSQPEPVHRWELPAAYTPGPAPPYEEGGLFDPPSLDDDLDEEGQTRDRPAEALAAVQNDALPEIDKDLSDDETPF